MAVCDVVGGRAGDENPGGGVDRSNNAAAAGAKGGEGPAKRSGEAGLAETGEPSRRCSCGSARRGHEGLSASPPTTPKLAPTPAGGGAAEAAIVEDSRGEALRVADGVARKAALAEARKGGRDAATEVVAAVLFVEVNACGALWWCFDAGRGGPRMCSLAG